MKTNYLQRNRRHSANWRRALLAVVVFVVIVYILSLVRVPFVSLASPLWQGENAAVRAVANSFSIFRGKSDIIEENESLRAQLTSYEVERMAIGDWRERETELLSLLGRRGEISGVAASVLAHPPQSPYDTLVIDAGSDDGIAVGDVVRMPEGPLLGTITETYGGISKVKLFTASGEMTSAVLERGDVSIELTGAGGGMFKFSVPRDVTVESGDRIVSADIRERLLGVVGDISMKPTDSFKEVSARSPGNIFGARFVFIEK